MDGAYSKITADKAREVDNLIKERTKHERLNKDSEKVDNNNKFATKLNSIVNKTSSSDNHIVFKNSGGLGVEPDKKVVLLLKLLNMKRIYSFLKIWILF